jgi:hypothetical protein
MLDYYGSIIKSESEVDSEIINRYRDMCHESYLKSIIKKLRGEGIIQTEYSVSGWMVFAAHNIFKIITIEINYKKQNNEKKIKLLYCYNQIFNDHDILRKICDYL